MATSSTDTTSAGHRRRRVHRSRWAAFGAAVAVALGAGGFGIVGATIDSGDKPVFVEVNPERIVDTRANVGPFSGPIAANVPQDVQVTGLIAIAPANVPFLNLVPEGATAVAVNVTVLRSTSAGFLSLRPAGAFGAPETSTVNFEAGATVPNAATVSLNAAGQIQIWVDMPNPSDTAHVLIDVVGYYEDHNHDDRYHTADEVDAAIAGVDHSLNIESVVLSDSYAVMQQIEIDAPTAGNMLVSASAAIEQTGTASVRCGITDVSTDVAPGTLVDNAGASNFGESVGWDVPAGATTIYLICRKESAAGTASVSNRSMTAVFSSNRL